MDVPKYDGNIHPDEWIQDIKYKIDITKNYSYYGYYSYHPNITKYVDSTISLPTGINSFEKLCNALKEDISFTVFKNTNKRKLQLLKYIPEKEGGDTSKFISTFRKLCYNSEIKNIEEQKKYLYNSLSNHNYFLTEFYKRMKNINSMNELIKEFEEVAMDETNVISSGSIVTLKHVSTGKYLSSIKDLHYTTGSKSQVVFVGSEPGPNSLWKINIFKTYTSYDLTTRTYINLQHKISDRFLGIYCYDNNVSCGYKSGGYKSPLTNHQEVSCNNNSSTYCKILDWKFNHSKLENQEYLKSNDIINLSVNNNYGVQGVNLRSHDFQFTIGNDTFQEVVCHNERIGGNDEWCIELIKQG